MMREKLEQITGECFRDFPLECLGCGSYRVQHPNIIPLTYLFLFYGIYQPPTKMIEKCLKYHKIKIS